MEFSQMGGIQCLIPEYSINGEVFLREVSLDLILLCNPIQHLRWNGSCVGSKDILPGFLMRPLVFVSNAAITTILMHILHFVPEFSIALITQFRVIAEECVMSISGWVLLWLEEGIEIPEWGLHILVGGHLLKSHGYQHLGEFLPGLQQWMQVSRGYYNQTYILLYLPYAFKLMFLKSCSFHLSFVNRSAVKSANFFLNSGLYDTPLVTLNVLVISSTTSFRFLSTANYSLVSGSSAATKSNNNLTASFAFACN